MYNIITIDGPAGVGKSEISKSLSNFLSAKVLNSGKIYRSIAYSIWKNSIDYENRLVVINFIKKYKYKNIPTKYIYTKNIDLITSKISSIPEVRRKIITLQRNFIKSTNNKDFIVIAEGRDMGSKIFPKAQVKIFLWANAKTRAQRRFLQIKKTQKTRKIEEILSEINDRDRRDMSRKIAPLSPAEDSYLIDNSNLDIEQCFNVILKIIKRHNIYS